MFKGGKRLIRSLTAGSGSSTSVPSALITGPDIQSDSQMSVELTAVWRDIDFLLLPQNLDSVEMKSMDGGNRTLGSNPESTAFQLYALGKFYNDPGLLFSHLLNGENSSLIL